MHGYHITWGAALSNASFDMDRDALKFSASEEKTLQINANCTADQPCVSDGDIVDTELSLDAPDGGAPVKVKIRTVIESILSCDNSRVLALPADIIVSRATRIRLKFFANDVDDAPVRYTRGEVQFRWAGKSFAAVWVAGRNEYVADIPSQWTELEGEYALTVSIRNGWKSSQLVEECVVFERVITVQGDAGQIIVAACLASLLMVSMFAVAFFIHRRTKSVKAFLVSFLKVEVILAVEICLELHASLPPSRPPVAYIGLVGRRVHSVPSVRLAVRSIGASALHAGGT
jgi:hypothetical protein